RFSSIYPPPLRSLFFPYTTLFRSRAWLTERGRLRGRLLGRGRPGAGFLPVSGGLDPCRTRTRGKQALVSVVPPDSVLDPKIPFEDRKSTRLNSSHEWISYAVFCLK